LTNKSRAEFMNMSAATDINSRPRMSMIGPDLSVPILTERLSSLTTERSEVRTLSKDIAGSPLILMAILWAGLTL